jgi:hypothetical protein
MAYSSVRNGVGSTGNRFRMSLANKNYTTQYFQNVHASGDIRAYYLHQRYASTGGGEVIRAVAEAYATGSAAGATINAAHFTGRVGAAKTISGALNAVRATLEVAGTTPTPGGTLAALQLDSNIVTGATLPATCSMARVTQSGATKIPNLFQLPVPGAKTAAATDLFVARHADATATHSIGVVDDAGTRYWFLLTTDTPAD